jgi:serine protease Do
MRFFLCSVTLLIFLISGCANTRLNASRLPKGVIVNKELLLPLDTQVTYYLPHNRLNDRFYLENWNTWVEPGKALNDGVKDAFNAYFLEAKLLDKQQETHYGLLVDIDPQWHFSGGQAEMVMSYQVFNGSENAIKSGKKSFKAAIGTIGNGAGLYNASLRATQLVLVEILNDLKPVSDKFPASFLTSGIKPYSLANLEKPVSTGTGFYINGEGQLLTAAHVLNDCMVIKLTAGEESIDVSAGERSTLLDLAVINTGKAVDKFLPFRKGTEIFLGEAVTNVGYPLQGLLAASPNLTRGNLSSRDALKGAVGQFQFSAPIQPGSSGGPVVSDGGELLGMTVSTLNAASLVKSGALPQNVNFALDAKYAARFLDKHKIPFTYVEPNLKGDIRIANDAALSAVVQLSCYQ